MRRLRYNGKHAGTPHKDIRECYRRVEECRRLAGTAMSELARFDYLEMEQRWLSLGPQLYEFGAPDGLHRR